MDSKLTKLAKQLDGDLCDSDLIKYLYATDASVYRKLPLAVALPKSTKDLISLVKFANSYKVGLIPRTAGTSLAGQCVGDGIVVDFSKYFTKILNFDVNSRTVTVQPGVVRDQLNNFLKPHGLFFGPNTSTSNRCMIGGMVGNNSSGTTSIKYGVTRDKIQSIETVLSDGSIVEFKNTTTKGVEDILKKDSLESHIYKTIKDELSTKEVRDRILKGFPNPDIHRRNNGYAIDELIKSEFFDWPSNPINLANIICGSEGTLVFMTAITLKLDPLPPKHEVMVALHYNSIESCLRSVAPLMEHSLHSCEMMDDTILNLTRHNKTQDANRVFIKGEPKAILMCELRASNTTELSHKLTNFIDTVDDLNFSYTYAILHRDDIKRAMELRKAGLGLLGNMIGDRKAVACIEDTAVSLDDLAGFIKEFSDLMKSYNQNAVYYAHAGAGELHLRPILNLKKSKDVGLFRKITTDVAQLVKRYNGTMSGEHGDGIVRSEFIPLMIGEQNYQILKRIKQAFDPNNIFNPGKIIDPLPMDDNLRYQKNREEPKIITVLDFSPSQGILRETEKCNGSGDCRKLNEFGGTMCPSYRATKNEKDTTRARANALREYLTNSEKANRFNHRELKEVFDLCLSCKACSSECPSSVDVAALKAEFLHQYQRSNGNSLRLKLFANTNTINKYLAPFAPIVNGLFRSKSTSRLFKSLLGIAAERSLPLISNKSLTKSIQKTHYQTNKKYIKTVYLFIDEFTNYLDTKIGEDAIYVLRHLNYDVRVIDSEESGRAFISNGFLLKAKQCANKNISLYRPLVSQNSPLVGIEPSAILSFKDEYIRLAEEPNEAKYIAKHSYLIEEFLQQEIELGHITSSQFTDKALTIKFHGHCHQKALSNQKSSFDVLNLPKNYKVTIIPSGCCGMAGGFGFEKEKYNLSMSIGNQTLFPVINKSSEHVTIAANGTSCRHQIFDGTQRLAKHPITILKEALL